MGAIDLCANTLQMNSFVRKHMTGLVTMWIYMVLVLVVLAVSMEWF